MAVDGEKVFDLRGEGDAKKFATVGRQESIGGQQFTLNFFDIVAMHNAIQNSNDNVFEEVGFDIVSKLGGGSTQITEKFLTALKKLIERGTAEFVKTQEASLLGIDRRLNEAEVHWCKIVLQMAKFNLETSKLATKLQDSGKEKFATAIAEEHTAMLTEIQDALSSNWGAEERINKITNATTKFKTKYNEAYAEHFPNELKADRVKTTGAGGIGGLIGAAMGVVLAFAAFTIAAAIPGVDVALFSAPFWTTLGSAAGGLTPVGAVVGGLIGNSLFAHRGVRGAASSTKDAALKGALELAKEKHDRLGEEHNENLGYEIV